MSEHNRHISIQRMARLLADPADPDRAVLRQHLSACKDCREVFEQVESAVERMPMPGQTPASFPALCPRLATYKGYENLPLMEKLSLWAHVVFGQCEDCATAAREDGLSLDIFTDPVTQSLVQRFAAKAPRTKTPGFRFAMAGAADGERNESPRTEAMRAVVMLTPRPKKRPYEVNVYRTQPSTPGGFWRVRVQFDENARLPRNFSMYIYEDKSPERPLRTSYTGEMEVDLPEGIYHLNFGGQDHLVIPLVPLKP
jgi:hypothetical protein